MIVATTTSVKWWHLQFLQRENLAQGSTNAGLH